MSLKRIVLASGAIFSLIASVADASAQYRYQDRPSFDARRDRPMQPSRPVNANLNASKKPVVAATKPVQVGAKPVPSSKPAETMAKPAPVVPLTDEQLAAKAAVDELLAREPALLAAKEIPDPALARAAAAKHDAQERRLAAMKAKEETDAAMRKDLDEKKKVREETKAAAIKAQQDARVKTAKPKVEPVKLKPAAETPTAPPAPSAAPLQPASRMPAPDGMTRRL